jgi:hypothetical protein
MKCANCHREYARRERRCPHCDAPNPAAGYFQTSTVMISERGSKRVYHSVEELPAPLRSRLERSTSGENSATILIADRRGHTEISKAVRGPAAAGPGLPNWFNRHPWRRKAILAALFGVALATVAAVFRYHWK